MTILTLIVLAFEAGLIAGRLNLCNAHRAGSYDDYNGNYTITMIIITNPTTTHAGVVVVEKKTENGRG